jgi:NAD(P)-dependent dehydrogenase (short-subunit alcohol dehydrogenase family)
MPANQAPTALVTGAARNLGLAFVRHYAGQGWQVIATCRDPASAADLATLARDSGGRMRVEALDVGDEASVGALAARLGGAPIDLLVNNAAIPGSGLRQPFGETDYAEWADIFRTNTMGPMLVSERLAANVVASGRKTILNISSRIGPNAGYGVVAYRASKTALNQITRQIAYALKDRGVICVAVHPGWVQNHRTPGTAAWTPDQSVQALAAVIDRLTPADSGKFFDPDGSELPLITQQLDPKPYGMA